MIFGNTANGVTGPGFQVGYTNNTVAGNGGDNTLTSTVASQ